MIDLHIHSTYSDGAESVIDILKLAEEEKLSVISITDHDTTKAYYELRDMDIKQYFSGTIIAGVEISTSFNRYRIELLAYGFSKIDKLDKFLKKTVETDFGPILKKHRNFLLKTFDSLNLKYDPKYKKELDSEKFETEIYDSLLLHNDNLKEILEDEYYESGTQFFRMGINNPDSKYYLDLTEYFPSIDEVIKVIHDCDGKVFVAHPFRYGFKNTEDFLNDIISTNPNIDGIEAFHSSSSKEEIIRGVKFAIKNKLLVSGGSDFHNKEKNIKLGFLKESNLNINQNLLSNW